MTKHLIKAAIVATIVALGAYGLAASGSDSGTNHVKAKLKGFQEVPAISTTGSGTIDLRIDDEAEMIEFVLTYDNLEGVGNTPFVTNGVVLAAHIHLGQRGVNGGVSAFFCGGSTKGPCPTPSGTVTGVITPADIVGPAGQGINAGEATAFAELVRAIRSGVTYANVHTTRWPGGEIRGQIRDKDRDD